MTTQELKQQIDKVLGNSIRCLLPSYWWKKMFGIVIDKVDEKLDSSALKTINGESVIGKGDLRVGVKNVASVEELNVLDGKIGDIVTVGSEEKYDLVKISDCFLTSANNSSIGDNWDKLTTINKIEETSLVPLSSGMLYLCASKESINKDSILIEYTYNEETTHSYATCIDGVISNINLQIANELLLKKDYRAVAGYPIDGLDQHFSFYTKVATANADAYIKGEKWTRLLKEGDVTEEESSDPIEILYYRIQNPDSTKEHNAKVFEQMNSSFVRLLFNDGSRDGNEIFCGTYGCSYVKLEDYFFIHVKDSPEDRVFKLTSDGTLTFDHRETYADSELSETSTNAVQNKAVYRGLADLAIAVDDLRKDKDKSYVIITASKQSSMTCYDSTNRITTVTLKPNIPTRVYTKRFKVSATSAIESIKLKHLDTSGVKDMSFMFYNGDALDNVSELDLSYFDTSLVTNMNHFVNLPKITKLDVTSFDTSNVTNMDEMFAGCAKLEELDVSLFKTHNVTNMYRVFGGCRELTHLNVSSFDTSKVTIMNAMFSDCQKLEEIDVTSFDTSNVTNMDEMFAGCQSLQYLDLSSFDTSNLDNTSRMQNMLYGCNNIQTLILGKNFFKVKKEASVGNELYGKAIYLVLPQWINDSVITSLVNNSYDRISNGLDIITLYLSGNTKSVLTEEHLEIMNAKGYNLR